MAKRRQPDDPSLDPARAVQLFRQQLSKNIESLPFDDPQVGRWWNTTENYIRGAFGHDHPNVDQFTSVFSTAQTRQQSQMEHISDIRNRKALLEGFIEQLEVVVFPEHRDLPGEPQMIVEKNEGRLGSTAGRSKRVFVVYGHDKAARTQLEAMLRRWELEPLILDQLPSAGMTVIEKVMQYSSDAVRFAVVLATPDDVGHREAAPEEKRYRARQNVVLELGLVLGKLGRSKVAILLKHGSKMERPSDIDGLIYIPFDNDVEEVKVKLAQEMVHQGLEIPLHRL